MVKHVRPGVALILAVALFGSSCKAPAPRQVPAMAPPHAALSMQQKPLSEGAFSSSSQKTSSVRISKSTLAAIMAQAERGAQSSLAGNSSFYEILSSRQKGAYDIEQGLAVDAAEYETITSNYFGYLRSLGMALERRFGDDKCRKLEYALAALMKKLVFLGNTEFAQICFNGGYAYCSSLTRMMSDFSLVNGMADSLKVILTPGHALVKIGESAYATSLEDLKWPARLIKYGTADFFQIYGARWHAELSPDEAVLFDTYEVASFKCNRKGDLAGELSYLDQMLLLLPGCADAHRRKGKCLIGLGRETDAIDSFSKAISYDPNDEQSGNYLLALARGQ